jgi:hypothetical protein
MMCLRPFSEEAMNKTILSALLWLACAAAWALPTVQQVEAEVGQGHYAQAESMMREVVEAKPGSAKGHYVYAEILAHNGNFAKAADEAAKAKQLDPELKFTQPEKFRAFEALLERQQHPAARSQMSSPATPMAVVQASRSEQAQGIPTWVWGGGLALLAYLLWRGLSRSRAAQAPSMAPALASAAPGNGFGAPGMAPMAPYGGVPAVSPSSGLLGTGLAVAGGVAAGMLVDEMLHRHPGAGVEQGAGLQPGFFDAPSDNGASRELERRDVDFGNGAEWDAGGGGAGLGGGGSDGGGWD